MRRYSCRPGTTCSRSREGAESVACRQDVAEWATAHAAMSKPQSRSRPLRARPNAEDGRRSYSGSRKAGCATTQHHRTTGGGRKTVSSSRAGEGPAVRAASRSGHGLWSSEASAPMKRTFGNRARRYSMGAAPGHQAGVVPPPRPCSSSKRRFSQRESSCFHGDEENKRTARGGRGDGASAARSRAQFRRRRGATPHGRAIGLGCRPREDYNHQFTATTARAQQPAAPTCNLRAGGGAQEARGDRHADAQETTRLLHRGPRRRAQARGQCDARWLTTPRTMPRRRGRATRLNGIPAPLVATCPGRVREALRRCRGAVNCPDHAGVDPRRSRQTQMAVGAGVEVTGERPGTATRPRRCAGGRKGYTDAVVSSGRRCAHHAESNGATRLGSARWHPDHGATAVGISPDDERATASTSDSRCARCTTTWSTGR